MTDTPTALASLAAGNLDFALATRDPEVQLNTPLIAIGRDAVVPIVSKSNPLDQLSVESLVRVLSGEITDWAELGRFGGPIQIHLLEEGTEQNVYLKNKILGDRLRGGTIKLHLSESGIADAIAKDPNALGIGVFSEIGNAKALNLIGQCLNFVRAIHVPSLADRTLRIVGRQKPKEACDHLRIPAIPVI